MNLKLLNITNVKITVTIACDNLDNDLANVERTKNHWEEVVQCPSASRVKILQRYSNDIQEERQTRIPERGQNLIRYGIVHDTTHFID